MLCCVVTALMPGKFTTKMVKIMMILTVVLMMMMMMRKMMCTGSVLRVTSV